MIDLDTIAKHIERANSPDALTLEVLLVLDDAARLLAEVRRLEREARIAAIETEERCIEEAQASREVERQRWQDAISDVAQGCTFEELAVCVRIRERAKATE